MPRVAVRQHPAKAAPNNLPQHLTSFVGRDADLRSLKSLLATSRMVTLVGTGGAGKSRLAVEVATASRDRWPDGVWWIELADANDVAAAVVGTLELPGRGPSRDVVSIWLAARRALLILDNCEHLVGACAAFSKTLLERCPQLSMLATSREALGVPGEARLPVGALPDADALRLFEARGRLVWSDFKLAGPNLKPVSEICERLDRLPLAIEMAAARLDVMSESELLRNLSHRLLTSGTRGSPERQQTMVAAIDWSHRLLTDDEARLFRRLAVFRGGFTLDAVQSVGADLGGDSMLELLSALVRKSMVVADRLADGTRRYRLLETHHEYALDKLHESAELELMRRRHFEYFMTWLDSATQHKGRSREAGNLWAALDWASAGTDDKGLGLAIKVADFEFSDQARTRDVLLDLLDRSPATGERRARALNLAARLVARQGDYELSRSLADSSVILGREVGDPDLIAFVVRGAGLVYHTRRELDAAAAMYAEALSLLKDSANSRLAIEVKNSLGVLAVERGDHAAAVELLRECVSYCRALGDQAMLAQHLESMANAQLGVGDLDAAASSWLESLSIFRDLGDPFGSIWCLEGLAMLAAKRGDPERAIRLAVAAERMSREWSLSTGPFRRGQLEMLIQQAASRLGERRREGARKIGLALDTAGAIDYALSGDASSAQPPVDAGPLSRREREVVAMVAEGLTNKQIAGRLFISERTAEGHVERIRNKLGVRSRTEVATWAVARGFGAQLDKSTPTSTV